nr:unnamed protein product [Leishmania braziliensis]
MVAHANADPIRSGRPLLEPPRSRQAGPRRFQRRWSSATAPSAASLPRIYGTAHVHRLLRYPRALLLLSHTAAVAFVVAAALRSQGELQRPIRGIARGASHCSSLQRRALPAAATPLARVQLAAAWPPYCCTGAVVKAWSALGIEFVQHEDCDLHAGIPRGTAPEPCDVRMAGLAFSADPHWGLRRPLATRPLLKLWDLATPYYIASESPYRVWRRTSFTP